MCDGWGGFRRGWVFYGRLKWISNNRCERMFIYVLIEYHCFRTVLSLLYFELKVIRAMVKLL